MGEEESRGGHRGAAFTIGLLLRREKEREECGDKKTREMVIRKRWIERKVVLREERKSVEYQMKASNRTKPEEI